MKLVEAGYFSMKSYMYILLCSDNSYYVGSTKDLRRRLKQHQDGEGANYTRKRLPVQLIYVEEYNRIDYAFNREKQVQGWSRKKKQALILGSPQLLPALSVRYGAPTALFREKLNLIDWQDQVQKDEAKRTNLIPRMRTSQRREKNQNSP